MIYEFLADGFEEIEAIAPCDILRRGGKEVALVAINGDKAVGSHGIEIKCDITIDDVNPEDIEMVILPGGMPGTTNLKNCEKLTKILNFCYKNDIYMAAICAAPSVFGEHGYLKGKLATCFPGFEDSLMGAIVLDEPVVIDENVITSKGAGTALQFGYALLSLFDIDKATQLHSDMQCK